MCEYVRETCECGEGEGEQIQFREVLCFHESYENGRRNGLSLSPPLNFSLGSASEADIRRIRVTPSPESNPSHPSHDHVTTHACLHTSLSGFRGHTPIRHGVGVVTAYRALCLRLFHPAAGRPPPPSRAPTQLTDLYLFLSLFDRRRWQAPAAQGE